MSEEKSEAAPAPAEGPKNKGHDFDKGLSKLQQRLSDLERKLDAPRSSNEDKLASVLQVLADRLNPPKPSEVDVIKQSIQSRLSSDDPEATKEAMKGVLAILDAQKPVHLDGLQNRIAQLEAAIEEQENARVMIEHRTRFQAKHPGVDFDRAVERLTDAIAAEYSEEEWKATPRSVRNRVSQKMLDAIAETLKTSEKPAGGGPSPNPNADLVADPSTRNQEVRVPFQKFKEEFMAQKAKQKAKD